MTEIDSIKFNDSLQYLTLENKRKVFGGGGIMPDVFVPLDTAIYPEFYKTWIQSGDIQSFIHLFVDNNRNFFKSNYNEFEKFKKDYLPNKTMIEELKKYVLQTESKNKKFKYDSENDKNLFENSNISTHLKALIANDLWNTQEYYSIMNENSKVYRKAIEIIENLKKYNDILAVK